MTRYLNRSLSGGSRIRSLAKSILKIIPAALFMAGILISCEEDPTSLGKDILPLSDFDSLVATDTLGVLVYTVYEDSSIASIPSVSFLGTSIDPYFGHTTMDFVTQAWITNAWQQDGLVSVDSVFIQLRISDVSGTMPESNQVNLYEVDGKLSEDNTYYSDTEVPVKGLLASFNIPALEEDTDTVLSVSLPVSIGERILQDTTMLIISDDEEDFTDYFHGLYFEYPQQADYHRLTIDLLGTTLSEAEIYDQDYYTTRIKIYYTNASGNANVFTVKFQSATNNIVMYNRYVHNYAMADPGKEIRYLNQPFQDTLSYAQGMNGVYMKLSIPDLEQFRDLFPLAVNRARLILPVYINEDDYPEENVPSSVYARRDSAGIKYMLSDYALDEAFMDGSYDIIANYYELNISNFVQRYIEGEIVKPEIEIFLSEYDSQNLILRTGEGDSGIKFEFVYTDLN